MKTKNCPNITTQFVSSPLSHSIHQTQMTSQKHARTSAGEKKQDVKKKKIDCLPDAVTAQMLSFLDFRSHWFARRTCKHLDGIGQLQHSFDPNILFKYRWPHFLDVVHLVPTKLWLQYVHSQMTHFRSNADQMCIDQVCIDAELVLTKLNSSFLRKVKHLALDPVLDHVMRSCSNVSFPSLQILTLTVYPGPLLNMPYYSERLRFVSIERIALTENDWMHLSSCSSLTAIAVTGMSLRSLDDPPSLHRFRHQLTHMTILHSALPLSELGFEMSMFYFPNLQHLCLEHQLINTIFLHHVMKNCKKLSELNISNTPIRANSLDILCYMPALRRLAITSTTLADPLTIELLLIKCAQLETLVCWQNLADVLEADMGNPEQMIADIQKHYHKTFRRFQQDRELENNWTDLCTHRGGSAGYTTLPEHVCVSLHQPLPVFTPAGLPDE